MKAIVPRSRADDGRYKSKEEGVPLGRVRRASRILCNDPTKEVSVWKGVVSASPIRNPPNSQTSTIMFSFKTFSRNESKIPDVSKLLHDISAEMGLTSEDLRGKKIMFKGDLLTVRNMQYICLDIWCLMLALPLICSLNHLSTSN